LNAAPALPEGLNPCCFLKGRSTLHPFALVLLLVLCTAPAPLNAQAPSFASDVFPILRDNCLACHSAQTKMGGLVMEDFAGLSKGGNHGPVFVAGKSAESRMILMLEGKIEPKMPVGGELPPRNLEILKQWIDAGAKGEAVSAGTSPIPDVQPQVEVGLPIGAVAFSPDSKLLAVARYKEVDLVDTASGKIHASLAGHAAQVRALAFSPDGALLAAAGGLSARSGEVKLWNVATREPAKTLNGHSDCIYAVDFSSDGKWLATSSYDKLILLWDPSTGQQVKTLKDHVDAVFDVQFDPGAPILASVAADRSIKLWDLDAGKPRVTLSEPLAAVLTVAFSPDGKRLAAAGRDKTIRTWSLDGESVPVLLKAMTGHEDAILRLVYSPDAKTLVSSSADRSLKIWDAATLEEKRVLGGQPDWAQALAFSPDGRQVVAGRYDGSLTFYDATDFKELRTLWKQPQPRAGASGGL
jgi:tricorn protease-like protein